MNDFFAADEDFSTVEDEAFAMDTDAWIAKMLG